MQESGIYSGQFGRDEKHNFLTIPQNTESLMTVVIVYKSLDIDTLAQTANSVI